MKTPDEIKNGLNHCSEDGCKQCPYKYDCDMADGFSVLAGDALDYIQQLERERDAAVEDLKSVVASNYFDGDYCKLCKYNEPDGECYHTCIPYSSKWGWEWRGVQEGE